MENNKAAEVESGQAHRDGRVKGDMNEMPSSSSETPKMSLLALPPEIRNKVYSMVIADAHGIPYWEIIALPDKSEFRLTPPLLAKVNRQLRHEILPMWYSEKSFRIDLHPETFFEVDQVWRGFVNRFNALRSAGTAHGGVSHLSYIRRLGVEFLHPADNLFLPYEPGMSIATKVFQEGYYNLWHDRRDMYIGVRLQFGHVTKRPHDSRRVGGGDTDWTDRDLVRALLHAAIFEHDKGCGCGPLRNCPHNNSWRPEAFLGRFPFERLVDLAMMIAAECKEAATIVYVMVL